MIKKRRDDEIEGAMDDEMELEIDEAVAASEEDGTIVPSGLGKFPLVPLREIVIFPEMVAPLKVGRDKSVAAIRAAAAAGGDRSAGRGGGHHVGCRPAAPSWGQRLRHQHR